MKLKEISIILYFVFLSQINYSFGQNVVLFHDFEKITITKVGNQDFIMPANVYPISGSPDLIQHKGTRVTQTPFGYMKGMSSTSVITYKPIQPIGNNCVGLFFYTPKNGKVESFYIKSNSLLKPSEFELEFKYSVYCLSSMQLPQSFYLILGDLKGTDFVPLDSILINGPFASHSWKKEEIKFKTEKEFKAIAIARNHETVNVTDTCTDHLRLHYAKLENSTYLLFDDFKMKDLKNVNPAIELPKSKSFVYELSYNNDEYTLDSMQLRAIENFVNSKKYLEFELIKITGSANKIGSKTYNKDLAFKRANEIEKVLKLISKSKSTPIKSITDLNLNERKVKIEIVVK